MFIWYVHDRPDELFFPTSCSCKTITFMIMLVQKLCCIFAILTTKMSHISYFRSTLLILQKALSLYALLKLYFKCLIISRYACAHCEQCLLSLDWISTRQIRPQLIFVPGQMPQTIIIRCRRHFFALLSSCLLRPGSWEVTKMLQSKSGTQGKMKWDQNEMLQSLDLCEFQHLCNL